MAFVSEIPDYQVVKRLLTKALSVDRIVRQWPVDQVDACLENVSKNVVLVPSSKALRKKSQREHLQTFHDGVAATVIGSGTESVIVKRDMCNEMERYMSFLHRNWPNDSPVSPRKLAKAGFFYAGVNDTVQCFSCTGKINNWDHGDTPIGEHKRLYPRCKFVRGTDARNVPYGGLVDESRKDTEGEATTRSRASSTRNELSDSADDKSKIHVSKLSSWEKYQPTSDVLDCFKLELNRLLSFTSWPSTSPVGPLELATSGFYCLNDTTAQCFACFGIISKWKPGQPPRIEHRRLFPSCPFVSGHPTENVPLSPSEKERAVQYLARDTARELELRQIPSDFSDLHQRWNLGTCACVRSTHLSQQLTPELAHLTVSAMYPDKSHVQTRLTTFSKWHQSYCQKPSSLAGAGYFATGHGDEVKCFHCGGGLKDWDEGDDPWEEHARWFPHCKWLLKQRGPEFVENLRRKESEVPVVTAPDIKLDVCKDMSGSTKDQVDENLETELLSEVFSRNIQSVWKKREERKHRFFLHDLSARPVQGGYSNLLFIEGMANVQERYRSFLHVNWPENVPVSPAALAMAGFFYVGEGDTVQCFSCLGKLHKWVHGDTAIGEHKRLYPTCDFVRKMDKNNKLFGTFVKGNQNDVPREYTAVASSSEEDCVKKNFLINEARESQPLQISKSLGSHDANFCRLANDDETNPVQLVTCLETTELFVKYAKYLDKVSEKSRLETYQQFPQDRNQIASNLAKAGFFVIGKDDEVKCFYSCGGLKGWNEGDDPWEEHARWFPRCEWLLQQRGLDFVDTLRKKYNQSYFEAITATPTNRNTSKDQQVEKEHQTQEIKSLEEREEEAFQSDVVQLMIDMGHDEKIVRAVIRKRLEWGQRPYENSEDLLTAIFEEEASQERVAGAITKPGTKSATRLKEEAQLEKGDTTTSLKENLEDASLPDVAKLMIDMGLEEYIVRKVMKKRLLSGQRSYEKAEDLLLAIFDEEESRKSKV